MLEGEKEPENKIIKKHSIDISDFFMVLLQALRRICTTDYCISIAVFKRFESAERTSVIRADRRGSASKQLALSGGV
jgi:hypothetical protein